MEEGDLIVVFGPFSLSDSLRLYRLQHKGLSLDLVKSLTQPQQPLWQAWLALMSQHAMGQPAYVLYDPHDGEAFIQVEYRPHQAAADIAYVAPALGANRRAANAWATLLEGTSREVAERGIQRLFASLPEGGPEVEPFFQVGFAPYAGEQIFRLACAGSLPESGLEGLVRPQQLDDLPALQRLGAAVVPQRVRQAEGGISLAPDKGGSQRHYVLPGKQRDEIAGILTIASGGSGYWMRLLVHPEMRHLAKSLACWGLSLLASQPPRPIYAGVRKYESGATPALEELGFELEGERVLLVKHTAAWVKVPAQELSPVLSGGARPVPPTFHMSGEPDIQAASHFTPAERRS